MALPGGSFTSGTDKPPEGPHMLAQALPIKALYEWNALTKSYEKLNQTDPNPPLDLPPGERNGQLIEIEKQ